MKKALLFFLPLILILVACQSAPATDSPAATPASRTVDTSLATPAIGFVQVLPTQSDKPTPLYAAPSEDAHKLAYLNPGQAGELLGFNVDNSWALVKIESQSGWILTNLLYMTADR